MEACGKRTAFSKARWARSASTAPSATTGPRPCATRWLPGRGPRVISNWTAAPVGNYVHVETADLYRPNARFTTETQGYQVLTPFGKLGYSPGSRPSEALTSLTSALGLLREPVPAEKKATLKRRWDALEPTLRSPTQGLGRQATDTQLNRQVALKILPDAFAADPDRLARFTREAQILASLNHPNIAARGGVGRLGAAGRQCWGASNICYRPVSCISTSRNILLPRGPRSKSSRPFRGIRRLDICCETEIGSTARPSPGASWHSASNRC